MHKKNFFMFPLYNNVVDYVNNHKQKLLTQIFIFDKHCVIIDLLECEHMFDNHKNNLVSPNYFQYLNIFYKTKKYLSHFVDFCRKCQI